MTGPIENFCGPSETFRGCGADSDCQPGDTCSVSKNRECFTDNGFVGGSYSVGGVADPPVNSLAAPTLGALFCLPPTTASSVNAAVGFPGPGRITLPANSILGDKIADGTLPSGGGTVTTDTENNGANPSDPLETTLTSPNGGEVILAEQAATGTPPGGFTLLGKQVNITAPDATPSNPLVIVFRIDASRIPAGQNQNTVTVFKNGVAVPDCTGAGATPDPCVGTRTLLGDGDVELTIRTSTASEWNFGVISLCPASPDPGCRTSVIPGKSSIKLKDDPDDTKDQIGWKWSKGQATSLGDYGDPTTTTSYALCLYDNGNLLAEFDVGPGGMCDGKDCWTAKPTSFKYKAKTPNGSGITQEQLKVGDFDGKTKIQVKGKGLNLPMPTLGSFTLPLTLELHNSTNSICWRNDFSTPTKNDSSQFKAKF